MNKNYESNWIKSAEGELSDLKHKTITMRYRMGLIAKVFHKDAFFKEYENDLHERLFKPEHRDLRLAYETLKDKVLPKMRAAVATQYESRLRRQIKAVSNKNIIGSVLVGPYVIDFLLPNVMWGGCKKVGLAIEVDGGCHNAEVKMSKDDLKDELLKKLGIAVIHVDNHDVGKKSIIDQIKRFEYFGAPDSRAVKRLWRRIYCYTLAHHLSETKFNELFCSMKNESHQESL